MYKNTAITTAALAAAVTVALTACAPPTEPAAAPSSSASVSDRDVRRASAQVAERELAIYGVLALPSGVDRVAAEAAAASGLPFVFSHGEGCSWVRTWDAKLWRLAAPSGGQLVRDETAEKAFRSNAGASDLWTCNAAENIPTADDPSSPAPYRWTDGGRTFARVDGAVYVVPAEISSRGVALASETIPGVNGVPIPN